jgi:hypothetical protein
VFGLDGFVDAEAWNGNAMFDVRRSDDEFHTGTLWDFDAGRVDFPLFHDYLADSVGRTGVSRSPFATGCHRNN